MSPSSAHRYLFLALGLTGLLLVYLFQRVSMAHLVLGSLADNSPYLEFIFNRTVRLVLNDAFCLLIILALFQERSYLRIAFFLFCFEVLVLLPVYLMIKLSIEGVSEISSPLLSHVHRLIVNPLLLFILIAGFYYQKYFHPSGK